MAMEDIVGVNRKILEDIFEDDEKVLEDVGGVTPGSLAQLTSEQRSHFDIEDPRSRSHLASIRDPGGISSVRNGIDSSNNPIGLADLTSHGNDGILPVKPQQRAIDKQRSATNVSDYASRSKASRTTKPNRFEPYVIPQRRPSLHDGVKSTAASSGRDGTLAPVLSDEQRRAIIADAQILSADMAAGFDELRLLRTHCQETAQFMREHKFDAIGPHGSFQDQEDEEEW